MSCNDLPLRTLWWGPWWDRRGSPQWGPRWRWWRRRWRPAQCPWPQSPPLSGSCLGGVWVYLICNPKLSTDQQSCSSWHRAPQPPRHWAETPRTPCSTGHCSHQLPRSCKDDVFNAHPTSPLLTIPYMARTATGSTAEIMLEKVKISTGARVMFMLYPVMLPWLDIIWEAWFVYFLLTWWSSTGIAGSSPIKPRESTLISRPPMTRKLNNVPWRLLTMRLHNNTREVTYNNSIEKNSVEVVKKGLVVERIGSLKDDRRKKKVEK